MSDISQLNVRLLNADIEIVKRLAEQRHVSQAVIVAEAIRLLDEAQNAYRRRFALWCIENEVPPIATMAERESYLESFDTEGGADDLNDTQQDALGVLI